MKMPWGARLPLMLALLVIAPALLTAGLLLPAVLSPFSGLSEGTTELSIAGTALAGVVYAATFVALLAGRLRLAALLGVAGLGVQVATLVAVAEPVFQREEREAAIRERYDAAAATHPTQVWCQGGFAYLQEMSSARGHDVMLHLPLSEGEFALRIAQYRVSDEHQSCDAAVFAEPYAVADRWFASCPEQREAFEELVARVSHPTACPYPTIHHWPEDASQPVPADSLRSYDLLAHRSQIALRFEDRSKRKK